MPEELFLTYADAAYLPLTEVLVRGLAHFSRRRVMVFGVNADVPYDSRNLIKRRIDCSRHEIYTLMFRILLESEIERGVYLDADNVPNRGIDELFAAARQVEEHPLVPRHPTDLVPHYRGLMERLGVRTPTLPYVQTCSMAFATSSAPFFRDCLDTAEELAGTWPAQQGLDEPIVNIMLWKKGARRHLDCCNIYHRLYETYLDGTYATTELFRRELKGLPHKFLTFHYCKDLKRARRLLAGLLSQNPQPVTRWSGPRSARDW